MSNDSNVMNDYFNEMSKYLINSADTDSGVNDNPALDKDKLLESFLMFQNFIKSQNKNITTNITNTPPINTNLTINSTNNSETSKAKEDNKIEILEEKSNQVEKQINFDEIPIIPKVKDFYELLETNLGNDDFAPVSKKAVEYKPRIKRTDKLDIKPTETKKYKYYSQNFNKNFGTEEIIPEPIIEKKEIKKNDNKKNLKNYEKPRQIVKKVDKSSKKVDNGNIWGNLNENDNEINDNNNFLDIMKDKNNNSNINNSKISENNLKYSENSPLTKLSFNDEGKFNKMNDNIANLYSFKTPNDIINSNDGSIKMFNKANIIKTNLKPNIFSEQVKVSKKENETKNFEIINTGNNSHNYSMNEVIEKNCNEQEEEDDDEDDNRDIMRMYQEKNKKIVQQEEIEKKPDQSKIMNKYFKSIVNKNTKSTSLDELKNEKEEDNSLNNLLSEKINELNKEIEKFKKENDKVSKLKVEYDRLTKKLNREIEEFNIRKENEINEFEQYKQDEIKKIEKERKVHNRNTKLLQNMPNRKEREEIDNLKEQVLKLQEEIKTKDQRNRLALDRMKKQYEESMRKNEELQKELKLMEELRLKTATNSTNNTNRDKSKMKYTSNNTTLSNDKSSKNLIKNASVNKLQTKKIINDMVTDDENDISYDMKDRKKKMNDKEKDINILKNKNIKDNYFTNNVFSDNNENRVSSKDYSYISKDNNLQKESFISDNSDIIFKNNAKVVKTSINNKNETIIKNTNKEVRKEITPPADEDNEVYEMVFPDKYHGKTAKNVRLEKQEITEDGKIIRLYENKKREVIFPSGVRKEIFDDGYQITYFNNKDIKQIYSDNREVYLFSENNTIQFKFPDGLQVFKFDNNQLEKHFPDGTKQVIYPDGTLRYVLADGYEETFFPDGSLQRIDKNGIINIDYEDGIKDTIYPDGTKTREFPDGRLKKILPDGTMENTYIK